MQSEKKSCEYLRWIDYTNHAIRTVRVDGRDALAAVKPDRIGVINGDHKDVGLAIRQYPDPLDHHVSAVDVPPYRSRPACTH